MSRTVCQLTAARQLELDHRPDLALAPSELIAALQAEAVHKAAPSKRK